MTAVAIGLLGWVVLAVTAAAVWAAYRRINPEGRDCWCGDRALPLESVCDRHLPCQGGNPR